MFNSILFPSLLFMFFFSGGSESTSSEFNRVESMYCDVILFYNTNRLPERCILFRLLTRPSWNIYSSSEWLEASVFTELRVRIRMRMRVRIRHPSSGRFIRIRMAWLGGRSSRRKE